MIVFDASAVVGAALKLGSIPEQALLRARQVEVLALSRTVDAEIAEVLARPKFAHAISVDRRHRVMGELRRQAVWFEPRIRVTDCRDAKDNKYLELAVAADAQTIASSDDDLLVLDPWRGIRNLLPMDYLGRD